MLRVADGALPKISGTKQLYSSLLLGVGLIRVKVDTGTVSVGPVTVA